MIEMFHFSKDTSIKKQLEVIWVNLYKDFASEEYFKELQTTLTLTESTLETPKEQLAAYLAEMSVRHYAEIMEITGMHTNLYELKNGDFIIAIDANVYAG